MNAQTNLEDSRISRWDRNLEHPQIYGNPNLPIEIQQSIQKNTFKKKLVFTYISPLKLFWETLWDDKSFWHWKMNA